MIKCRTLDGKTKWISKDKMRLRPSAYGIIRDRESLLLVRMKSAGKYFFPGGGVELGEKVTDSLTREVKEETGIDIEVERFFIFREDFFYYEPNDTAFHGLLLFFLCRPTSWELIKDNKVEDDNAEKPRWVKVSDLKKNDFYGCGKDVFSLWLKEFQHEF